MTGQQQLSGTQGGKPRRMRYVRILTIIVSLLMIVVAALALIPLRSHSAHAQSGPPLGAEVGPEYYTFVDQQKEARGFASLADSTSAVPTDARGWPTSDARVILISLYGNTSVDVSGDYKLSFQGQATVTPNDGTGNFQIANQVYNSATNTTTADVIVPPNDGNLELTFTNTRRTPGSGTNTGVTNVKCIRPGYPADGSQLYTTPFLNALAPFRTIRTMDMAETNNSSVVNWSDRNTPNSATQTKKGVSLEYLIALANASGKDLWINVPHQATDDYVTKLAQLVKYGSDGTNPYTSPQSNPVYRPLNSNLHLYVEYSNEVMLALMTSAMVVRQTSRSTWTASKPTTVAASAAAPSTTSA